MAAPRVYADFQNLDDQSRLRLTCAGTRRDLEQQGIQLQEGLVLALYSDDANDEGQPDELRAEGIAHYDPVEKCWVAVVDWQKVHHASDKSGSNGGVLSRTPEDLYWKDSPMFRERSLERVRELERAASSFRAAGRFLAAGITMSDVMHAGWGLLPMDHHAEAVRLAIADFKQCVGSSPEESLEAVLALKLWSLELLDWKSDTVDPRELERARQETYMAMAQRLVKHYSGHPNSVSFLVRGFRLSGPITGPWTPEFPETEVDDSGTDCDLQRRTICYRIPSAFRLMVRVLDYRGAWEIYQRHPSAFTSPGLKGWRLAVEGFIKPELSHDLFAQAASAFEQDTLDQQHRPDGGWSSINLHLWAPCFRARSWLSGAFQDPERARECIAAAVKSLEADLAYSHRKMRRFRLLVRALGALLHLEGAADFDDVRSELRREFGWSGPTDDDSVLSEFLENARIGFYLLQSDRRRGLTSIGRAMSALDRLSLEMVGRREAEGIGEALDRHVGKVIEGTSRLWIYRTLECIRDENKLRKVLLRLFQNSVPKYAQIRHGPIEYGTDIAVVVGDQGQTLLCQYQVKCGDIREAQWNKTRPQLEKIFQVPLKESFQTTERIDRRTGILIWNGHAEPHVEPVMDGWKRDQLKAHQRDYDFMNLDRLVNYVLDRGLPSALREALSEAGVPIVP